MLIKKPTDIKSSEITDYEIFKSRRRFIQGGAALALGLGSTHVSAMTPNPVSNGEAQFQRKEKFPSV
ncbi:MAG: twin-arginine translocation signal domain-containing protein, partial [Gammaproteobacteria bacterium]|nr:twin-arginine translocation signal domain-containing protein [Gammaproteobacteria bacterium]